MNDANKIINGLWIGSKLSVIELLCIQSYINHGHIFKLWLYNSIETELPVEVVIKDANEIIPFEKVFCYQHSNQFGHGKGSYAGFSDIFRYKLLYDIGGWWTDMDVICLKYFDFPEPYVFRTHHDFPVIGNIMKCPQASFLMQNCYQEALNTVNENNTDWNLPIKILNKNIAEQKLEKYIIDFSNPDDWRYLKKLIIRNISFPQHWFAIHLLNEEWRRNKIYKDGVFRNSSIGKQIVSNLPKQISSGNYYHKASNFIRISRATSDSPTIMPKILRAKWLLINLFWKIVRTIQRKVFKIHKT